MTRNDLIGSLIAQGYYLGDWAAPADVEYSSVSPQFVREARGAWVESLPDQLVVHDQYGLRQPRWQEDNWDCDDLAKSFLLYVEMCIACDAVTQGKKRGALAGGRMDFMVDDKNAHAIVWFCDHGNVVHHFDPANGKLDHLSREQIGSIFAGAFA